MADTFDNMPDPLSPLDIAAVGGRIGAEVRGLHLGPDIAESDVDAIEAALARHKVLFFRGQGHLTDETQERFAERMGTPVAHPLLDIAPGSSYLLELATSRSEVAAYWHTDVTFTEAYPRASILRGVRVPAAGGDTMWANTASAYAYLPPILKELADRLWAVHTNVFDYYVPSPGQSTKGVADKFMARQFEAEHPVVRVHPVTGERNLLLGGFVRNIVGLAKPDSDALLAIFHRHIYEAENVVRWRWNEGDLVMWDNRATQHRVTADCGAQERVVRRVTLAGDVPVGIDGRTSRQLLPEPMAIAAE